MEIFQSDDLTLVFFFLLDIKRPKNFKFKLNKVVTEVYKTFTLVLKDYVRNPRFVTTLKSLDEHEVSF